MKNWLVKHAYEHIWCDPSNDRRWIVHPTRLTKEIGARFGLQVQGYSIQLPSAISPESPWFHVFQLGKMNHQELNIDSLKDTWVRLDVIMNYYGPMITLYNLAGRTFPLEYSWIRKQPNGNVLVAVEMVTKMTDFSKDDLFIRFYAGQFSKTTDYKPRHKCSVYGKIVRNAADRFDMITRFNSLRQQQGEPVVYVNGYEVDIPDTNNINLWDYVELVQDGLVEEIHYFPVKDLLTFHSELDGKRKYLLHPPKQIDTIHFINDIDISILKDGVGVYYHQHQSESFRQVTHNDYSLLVDRLNTYITNNQTWSTLSQLTVKMTIRRSGMDRSLIFTHNRIKELYKLTDKQIVSALTGMDSSVSEWQASVLEQSAYNRIMAARYPTITNELCTEAYGYNSVSKYVADTPTLTKVVGGKTTAQLPPLLTRNCTVFEYDKDGLLLGFYNYSSNVDNLYICKNTSTKLVEVIEGQGGKILHVIENQTTTQLEEYLNYRFYTRKLLNGNPTQEYEDVTDNTQHSIDGQNKVSWSIDRSRYNPVILSDKQFLLYSFKLDMYHGNAKFSVDHWINSTTYYPCPFVPETLDVWLNGRLLVPTIDYFVNWPTVVITNKRYLTNSNEYHKPTITVRCRGLAKELSVPKVGFVVNNLLSNDSLFDVRDDKVTQIAVAGSVKHVSAVKFREDTAVGVSSIYNGLPYLIGHPTIPLRELVSENTYVMRDIARDLDDRVEKYLTHFIPTPPQIDHNPINEVYDVFSPIMNKVIHDMIEGDLEVVADDELFYISTRQFDTLMDSYRYLLEYEPTLRGTDLRYVEVHPHDGYDEIELTPIQMALVERLNDRYLNNKVIINKLLKIKV